MRRWVTIFVMCGCGAAGAGDAGIADAGRPDGPRCSLVPNGGCRDAGACDLDPEDYSTAGTTCREPGPGHEESDCAGGCAAGYTCFPTGTDFSCGAFCRDDGDCAGDGARCVLRVIFDDGENPMAMVPGITLCSQRCDPLTAAGCPPGWACRVVRGPEPYTQCTGVGPGEQGAACAGEGDCAAGYACAGACFRLCARDDTGACDDLAGTACTAFGDHPTFGGREFGVCHE